MTFDQPADHGHPEGVHFQQRLTLLHRDVAAPMIIFNSGYDLDPNPSRSEPTRFVNGNQLSCEHRYFAASRPDPTDWTLLDIEQAAADQHRVIQAFKTIYGGRWLSTGASKGGMTSIFHRRFYLYDVDGTVAYVAPITYAAGLDPGADQPLHRVPESGGER